MLTLEKWDSMSLSEQYEMVFLPSNLPTSTTKAKSSLDPSS